MNLDTASEARKVVEQSWEGGSQHTLTDAPAGNNTGSDSIYRGEDWFLQGGQSPVYPLSTGDDASFFAQNSTLPKSKESAESMELSGLFLRESWLQHAKDHLVDDVFMPGGLELPEGVVLSCGWPSSGGLARKARAIGECWAPDASADGKTTHVFISPLLADGVEVLATLVHELCHAIKPGAKHGPAFKRMMNAVGLEGKATGTHAGDALKEKLSAIVAKLGAYPHAAITPAALAAKKQGTRMLKVVCPGADCGYTVRTTKKWAERGMPTCFCGEEMELADGQTLEESEDA